MTVERICNRLVVVAHADDTVREAAHRMRARNVGTLVVCNEEQRPIGILTDRDLVVKVLAEGVDPEQARVADVMTQNPQTVTEETPITSALNTMKTGGFRRLPVVDGMGRLVGIVSLDDVVAQIAEESHIIEDILRGMGPHRLRRMET